MLNLLWVVLCTSHRCFASIRLVRDNRAVLLSPVKGLTLSHEKLTLKVGTTETLTVSIVSDNATNKDVEWSSDKPDVAVVNSSGEVTVKTEGSATITATTPDGKFTASCSVIVVSSASTEAVDTVWDNVLVTPNPFNSYLPILRCEAYMHC